MAVARATTDAGDSASFQAYGYEDLAASADVRVCGSDVGYGMFFGCGRDVSFECGIVGSLSRTSGGADEIFCEGIGWREGDRCGIEEVRPRCLIRPLFLFYFMSLQKCSF